MNSQGQVLTLKRLIALARLWLPFILLGSIVAGVTVFLATSGRPEQYKATARLLIGIADQTPGRNDTVTAGQGLARTYARIFDDPQLYKRAADELAMENVRAADLQANTAVFAVRDTQIVDVEVTWTNRQDAIKMANLLADVFADNRREQALEELKPAQEEIKQLRAALEEELRAVPRSQYNTPATNALTAELNQVIQSELDYQRQAFEISKQISVVAPASTADVTGLATSRLALIAALISGAVALGLVILAEMFIPTLIPEDVAQRLGLAAPITLPRLKDRAAATWRALIEYSDSATAQVLRLLPGSLPANTQVTTVAGIGKRTDSATVAAGLAAAYAERGKRVLLVDANLNEPRLDTLLGLHAGAGLHQVLRGKGSLKEALIPTPLTDVTLLAAGPLPAQSEKAQISPEQISNLLEQLRGQFDLVIVDLFEPLQQRVASSVLADTDTLMLVAHEREISESSLRPYAIWSRQSTSAEMPTLVIYNGANGNDPSQSQPALIPQAKGS